MSAHDRANAMAWAVLEEFERRWLNGEIRSKHTIARVQEALKARAVALLDDMRVPEGARCCEHSAEVE